jgi:hypothetical protein
MNSGPCTLGFSELQPAMGIILLREWVKYLELNENICYHRAEFSIGEGLGQD